MPFYKHKLYIYIYIYIIIYIYIYIYILVYQIINISLVSKLKEITAIGDSIAKVVHRELIILQ